VIRRLKAFGAFWYDFVIGDDWTVAAGVAAALVITAIVVRAADLSAWWIVPVAIVVLLPVSMWRAVRADRGAAD
jgi:hypothetical protein